MQLNPAHQIQSISDFRSQTDKLLKLLGRFKTILLTQHGKAKAILLDLESYEEQQRRLALLERLLKAQQELSRDEGVSHADAEKVSQTWLK